MYGRQAAGVLAGVLGNIAHFCIDNDIPPLTAIIVGKRRGAPGTDIPVDPSSIDEERENVYRFNWYDIYPPSESDLKQAAEKYKHSAE